MSGLLDKAEKAAEEVADVIIEKENLEAFNGTEDDAAKKAMFNIAGSVMLVVVLGTIFYYNPIYVNWLIFAPLLIASWALYNGADLIRRDIVTQKLMVSGVVFMMVSAAIIGASLIGLGSGGGLTITTIELDGNDDELEVTVYGSSGSSFDIEVQADGVATCTKSGSINIDKTTVSLPLIDCWSGNGLDADGDKAIDYRVIVTDGENEDSYGIKSDYMTREANVGLVEMLEYKEYEDGEGGQQGTAKHEGMYVSLWVGHGDATDTYQITANSSAYGGNLPQPITTDVDVKVEILFDGQTLKTWDFKVKEGITNGYGEFYSGWVLLPGGGPQNTVPRSVYDDDGCYTFKVTLTNDVGDTFVDDRSKLDLHWNDNDADDDSTNNQDPEVC
ncbi:MAG: hypothetical protein QGI21_06020 [Candidatus Poseidoniaceae archaeon]|jgi:hypothetical protein|nr:hypothetical protein [Candidatus Poseidoniaceae archaeon]